jgi:hypothetical protein
VIARAIAMPVTKVTDDTMMRASWPDFEVECKSFLSM